MSAQRADPRLSSSRHTVAASKPSKAGKEDDNIIVTSRSEQPAQTPAIEMADTKRTGTRNMSYAKCGDETRARRDKCISNISENWSRVYQTWFPEGLLPTAPPKTGQRSVPRNWSGTFLAELERLSHKTKGDQKMARDAMHLAYRTRLEDDATSNCKLLPGDVISAIDAVSKAKPMKSTHSVNSDPDNVNKNHRPSVLDDLPHGNHGARQLPSHAEPSKSEHQTKEAAVAGSSNPRKLEKRRNVDEESAQAPTKRAKTDPMITSCATSTIGRDQQLISDTAPPCSTLYLGQLPLDTSWDELEAVFSKQHDFLCLRLLKRHAWRICFIEFRDTAAASDARAAVWGHAMSNGIEGGLQPVFAKPDKWSTSRAVPSQSRTAAVATNSSEKGASFRTPESSELSAAPCEPSKDLIISQPTTAVAKPGSGAAMSGHPVKKSSNATAASSKLPVDSHKPLANVHPTRATLLDSPSQMSAQSKLSTDEEWMAEMLKRSQAVKDAEEALQLMAKKEQDAVAERHACRKEYEGWVKESAATHTSARFTTDEDWFAELVRLKRQITESKEGVQMCEQRKQEAIEKKRAFMAKYIVWSEPGGSGSNEKK